MVDTALLNWTLSQVFSLLVIMARVGPLIFLMPIIGSSSVPTQVKVLATLTTSLVLLPVLHISATQLPRSVVGLVIFVGSEITIGAILALFARMVLAALEIAGQVVSISMGMGMAGALSPQFGTQVSLVGNLWSIVAILVFLAIDGHHIFIRTMVDSFVWLPPGTIHITGATFRGMMRGASHMFVLSIQIMAPAGVALFLANVAMGIIAKTVPQVPIMIVGMPMNIAIGFIFIALSMSYLLPLLISNFAALGTALTRLSMGMGG
ncbi:MAG: flagellar biosynthetic protein FliR [Deltaproteobacteria bacterium]|nr:flagellar biosynthetic protein FliR [Deltaproteobacteria bacterium]